MQFKYGAEIPKQDVEHFVVPVYGVPFSNDKESNQEEDKKMPMDINLFIVISDKEYIYGVYNSKELAIEAAKSKSLEDRGNTYFVAEVVGKTTIKPIEIDWIGKGE